MKHFLLASAAGAFLAAVAPGAPASSGFDSRALYERLEAQARAVKPRLEAYTVRPGLANVANLRIFKKELSAAEKALVAKNLFVVSPIDATQMSEVYENNEYRRPEKMPAFITTDAMLHTYHMFYDYSLRTVEATKLCPACEKLTKAMLAEAKKDYAAARTSAVKSAAKASMGYFAVASALLNSGRIPPGLPGDVKSSVREDLKSIEAHAANARAATAGVQVDFSQFVPRGHYTRTAQLKRYFKAMMWYGNVGFPAGSSPDTLVALLVARELRRAPGGEALWQTIYEPTVFFVGRADDYTPQAYAAISDRVYGQGASVDALADPAKLTAFAAGVHRLPGPGITGGSLPPQFRFMGQRFIPDSRVFQELTHDRVWGRDMPVGLDLFAAMGSKRALDLLVRYCGTKSYPQYAPALGRMKRELAGTTEATWTSNLYYGWLWSLKSIAEPAPSGYPSFMLSPAWVDKDLLTGLGSWTELRHDTILYAKQSAAECGGDEEKEPPLPKGYVEPALEVWTKLEWLNDATFKGLSKRKLLTSELRDTFEKLGDWIDFCRSITVKELEGREATRAEYKQMTEFGGDLAAMLLTFAGGNSISESDEDMAVVADVHTGASGVLEEGTGRAGAIYVVVPIGGKLYLTRGATYTQYEFVQPASDRLTDEQWKQMLEDKKEPALAAWTKSFLVPKRKPLGTNEGE
jgi:hypothetical protein